MQSYRVTLFDDDTHQKAALILLTSAALQSSQLADIIAQAFRWCDMHDHFNFKIDKIERLAEGEI